MTPAEQVREKLATLEQSVLSANPNIPVLLKQILEQLKADPDVVTIFTPEDIAILTSGLKRQTQVVLTTAKSKVTARKGASLQIGTDL